MVSTISDTTCATLSDDGEIFHESAAPLCLEFIFIPPWRISDMAIRLALSSSMEVSVNRARINSDPRLLQCLKDLDTEGLKTLISQGRAKPTDLVLRYSWKGPESLLEVNEFSTQESSYKALIYT
jgi:hypothetical protein